MDSENKGGNKDPQEKTTSNPDLENTLNYYSDEMTKEIVGRLFEEFATEGGKNYFANRSRRDDVLYNAEDDEKDNEDDSAGQDDRDDYDAIKLYTPRRVRSKRTDSSAKRNKSKKKLKAELERAEEETEEVEIEAVDETPDAEVAATKMDDVKKSKSPFLPKLSEFGKTYKQDVEEELEDYESVDEDDYDGYDEDYDEDIDDDDDEYNVISISKNKIIIVVVVLVCLAISIALLVRGNSYKKQLEATIIQMEEVKNANTSTTYEKELNELKAKVEQLTAENAELKASGAAGAGDAVLSDIEKQQTGEQEEAETEGSVDTYTVKDGDTFWKISQSVYGNGAEYQKILDANGLSENSPLSIGQELKIPK